jgi:hypothetical protein
MVGGALATMTLRFPSAMKRTAAAPKRRAISRSKVVGEPPRCRCPRTRERVSLPVRLMEFPGHPFADPAQEDLLAALFARALGDHFAALGLAPSATTTIP